MDIKDQLNQGDKTFIINTQLEVQVLTALLNEKKQTLAGKVGSILTKLGYSPERYGLKVNSVKDEWEVKLKQGVITLPGEVLRSH